MFNKRDYNATIIKILFCVVCYPLGHFRRKTSLRRVKFEEHNNKRGSNFLLLLFFTKKRQPTWVGVFV